MSTIQAGRSRLGLRGAVLAGFAAVALPYLSLAWFTFPSGDDFCYGGKGLQLGAPAAMQEYLLNWGGRYLPALYLHSAPAAAVRLGGFDAYYLLHHVVTFAISLALIISVYVAARSLTLQRLSRGDALLAAGLFFALQTTGMPSPAEYYSVPYSLTYIGGVALTLWFAAAATAVIASRESSRDRRGRLIFACLLCAAAAGCNESAVLGLGTILTVGVADTLRERSSSANAWRIMFGVFLLCATLALGAPGNASRMEKFREAHEVQQTGETLLRGPRAAIKETLGWAVGAGPLLAGLVILLAGYARAESLDPAGQVRFRHLAMATALTLIFLVEYQLPSLWATGWSPPPRVMNAAYAVAILGGMATAALAGVWLRNRTLAWPEGRTLAFDRMLPATSGIATVALLASLLWAPSYRLAVSDLRLRAVPYAAQMRLRFRQIDTDLLAGERNVRVEPLEGDLPLTIHFPGDLPWNRDLTEQPENAMNRCYARLYGLETIALAHTAPPAHAMH